MAHTLTTGYQSGDCEPSTGHSGCTTDRWLFRPPLGMQVRGYTPTISLILLPTDQNPLFRLIKNVGLCRVTRIATSFEETTFDDVDTGERIPRPLWSNQRELVQDTQDAQIHRRPKARSTRPSASPPPAAHLPRDDWTGIPTSALPSRSDSGQ